MRGLQRHSGGRTANIWNVLYQLPEERTSVMDIATTHIGCSQNVLSLKYNRSMKYFLPMVFVDLNLIWTAKKIGIHHDLMNHLSFRS